MLIPNEIEKMLSNTVGVEVVEERLRACTYLGWLVEGRTNKSAWKDGDGGVNAIWWYVYGIHGREEGHETMFKAAPVEAVWRRRRSERC